MNINLLAQALTDPSFPNAKPTDSLITGHVPLLTISSVRPRDAHHSLKVTAITAILVSSLLLPVGARGAGLWAPALLYRGLCSGGNMAAPRQLRQGSRHLEPSRFRTSLVVTTIGDHRKD